MERFRYNLTTWWWAVALLVVICGALSYWAAVASPGSYRASATLLVNLTQTPGTIVLDDAILSERLTATYQELAVTGPVLEVVASRLGGRETVGELRASLDASAITGTQLIRISAKADDPDRAAILANTAAEVITEENNLRLEGTRLGTLSVVENAETPAAREGPSLITRAIMGAIAGAALGFLLVLWRTYFDNTLWNEEDVRDIDSQIRTLGVIPRGAVERRNGRNSGIKMLMLAQPWGLVAANVLATLRDPAAPTGGLYTIAIMSAVRGEGRTTIAAHLGTAVALEGHHVTLVDFDRAHPALHTEFRLSNDVGITDWLSPNGSRSNRNITQPTTLANMRVVTAGCQEGLPAAHVSTRDARHAFEELQRLPRWSKAAAHADSNSVQLLLIDCPPRGEESEALLLAQVADAAIVVVRTRRTPAALVRSTINELGAVGLPILGVVLNDPQ